MGNWFKDNSSSFLDLGAGITSSVLNYFLTDDLNEKNAERNQKYWDMQIQRTHQLNEKSADNAMYRTINLYNQLQSPKAMVQQYKEAGLNPALMYSMGGSGGHVASGNQASSPNAMGAGNSLGYQKILGIDPNTIANLKIAEAEEENIKEDTNLKKTEANLRNEQALSEKEKRWKWKIEAQNIDSIRRLNETLIDLNEQSYQFNEATWESRYQELYNKAIYWNGEAQSALAMGVLDQETYEVMKLNRISMLVKINTEIDLNKKLKEKYGSEIKLNDEKRENLKKERNQINAIITNINKQNEEINKNIELKDKYGKTEDAKKEYYNRLVQSEIDKYDWSTISKEDAKWLVETGVMSYEAMAKMFQATFGELVPF